MQPRATEADKNYALLGAALFLGAVGSVSIAIKPKLWIAPIEPRRIATAEDASTEVPVAKDALRRIDWYQFEKVSARLLEMDGWRVARRGGANPDGGADLIARKDGFTAVVQCKHWKSWKIDPKVMRELLGTKVSAGFAANSAILFTLGDCSGEAARFAGENGITVYGATDIEARIRAVGVERFPELLDPNNKRCPKCDAPMVLRGSFWGCSNYGPLKCRGTIEA